MVDLIRNFQDTLDQEFPLNEIDLTTVIHELFNEHKNKWVVNISTLEPVYFMKNITNIIRDEHLKFFDKRIDAEKELLIRLRDNCMSRQKFEKALEYDRQLENIGEEHPEWMI